MYFLEAISHYSIIFEVQISKYFWWDNWQFRSHGFKILYFVTNEQIYLVGGLPFLGTNSYRHTWYIQTYSYFMYGSTLISTLLNIGTCDVFTCRKLSD